MKARPCFPPEEYDARWERVSDEMASQGFDVALVWSRSAGGHEKFGDVFYLRGRRSRRQQLLTAGKPEGMLELARNVVRGR